MSTSNLAPRFVKGGKPGPGRPKGSIAQSTLEIRAFCRSIIDSPEYRQKLYEDMTARRCSPQVELHMWDRAYGPVPREVRIDDVQSLDTEDLLRRMRAIAAAMPETDVLPKLEGEELEGEELEGTDDGNEPPA